MKEYLKEQSVSQITDLKLPTLRNHRHLRKGIPYIKIGRAVRYDPADVEAYMRKHRVDPEVLAEPHPTEGETDTANGEAPR